MLRICKSCSGGFLVEWLRRFLSPGLWVLNRKSRWNSAFMCVCAWFSKRWWSVGKYLRMFLSLKVRVPNYIMYILRFITKAGGCSQEVIPEYPYLQCFGAGVWYTIKLMISACPTPQNVVEGCPDGMTLQSFVYVSSGKRTLRFLEKFTFPQ